VTVSIEWFGGVIGIVVAAVALGEVGITITNKFVVYGLVFGAGILGTLAWVYSPLPDSNGGIASHDPQQGRYWGMHPGPRDTAPEYISEHKTDDRVIYYYEDDCVAVDRACEVTATAETAEKADQLLREKLQQGDGS
jgi:hypothetical protein